MALTPGPSPKGRGERSGRFALTASPSPKGRGEDLAGSTEPQFTPTRIAQSCCAGHVGQEADLVLPGAFRLVVIEMARVVANFIDQRGHVGRQPVVFLQIDREVRVGAAAADFSQCLAIAPRVGGDPHHARPRLDQLPHLRDGRLDVGRFRGAHALHHDRIAAADRHRADLDGPGEVAGGYLAGCRR